MQFFNMKTFVLSACFVLFAFTALGQQKQAILKVLETQRVSWNNGDLDEFMGTYWKSDSLVFVGQNGPEYGWQSVLDNYKKAYPDKAAMGILTFDIKEVRFITGADAFVLGAWHLRREKDQPKGYFTLMLKKIKGEWKIVSDHSS